MRLFKILALTGLVAMAATACADLEVTNLNDPDRQRAITTPGDVETLIAGAFTNWWAVAHYSYPSCALAVAADSHSSSWGNWGMRDSGWEPRKPFNNDPAYSYSGLAENPWGDSYAALAGVRDGLAAINDGIVITEAGVDVTQRAVAFGKLTQAMALSNLAVLYDQAFIVDENTDLEALEFVTYDQVWAGALEKFAEAISIAQSNSFTIPDPWVGMGVSWTSSEFAAMAKAFRARYRLQIGRTPAEQPDWNAVLADMTPGIPFEYSPYDDNTTAFWGRDKLHCAGIDGWARMDNRTLGPADVSGNWEIWINAGPDDKLPFDITTPDSRITEPMQPQTDGSLFAYYGNSPFPRSRGIYHFGHYVDTRYNSIWQSGYTGNYDDYMFSEQDLIRAEAMYMTGDIEGAKAIVNQYRANGGLPPFVTQANPDGEDMCVPQMPNGSCGDLFEALKYEKRIECFHNSFVVEFTDDRRWGDLVEDTFLQLPVPGSELLLLIMDIYTFGGPGNGAVGGGVTPDIINDFSPEALSVKRQALERYNDARERPNSFSKTFH